MCQKDQEIVNSQIVKGRHYKCDNHILARSNSLNNNNGFFRLEHPTVSQRDVDSSPTVEQAFYMLTSYKLVKSC